MFPVKSTKKIIILNVEVANATKGHDLSKRKVILKYFFNWHSIMHHEFILGGTTVKKDRYKQILTTLHWRQCISEVF
jgi:hypothetical protein